MAEYVTQIFFIIAAIAFVGVFLTAAGSTYNEYSGERITLYEDTTLDDSWNDAGDNWAALENEIPIEAFSIIVVPIIIIVAYIAIRVTSSILPNWLSGG